MKDYINGYISSLLFYFNFCSTKTALTEHKKKHIFEEELDFLWSSVTQSYHGEDMESIKVTWL